MTASNFRGLMLLLLVSNVDVILRDQVFEPLVEIFAVCDDLIFSLCVICYVDIIAVRGLDLERKYDIER